jgi:hypothetical protein
MLLDVDLRYFEKKGYVFEQSSEDGMLCIVIKDYPLPSGYTPSKTDLLLRLPSGFPDVAPDMFWCDPPVRLNTTGTYPQAAEVMQPFLGRTWQRFSRHLAPGSWLPGTHTLQSYLPLIRRNLEETAKGTA